MAATHTKPNRKNAIAIADDVLDHLDNLRFRQLAYVEGKLPAGLDLQGTQAQEHVDTIQEKCGVCALGACMLSHVRVLNKVSTDKLVSIYSNEANPNLDYMFEQLSKSFGYHDMYLIETVFERALIQNRDTYNKYGIRRNCLLAAISWGMDFPDKSKRIEEIMYNITDNGGELLIPSTYFTDRQQRKALARIRRKGDEHLLPENAEAKALELANKLSQLQIEMKDKDQTIQAQRVRIQNLNTSILCAKQAVGAL